MDGRPDGADQGRNKKGQFTELERTAHLTAQVSKLKARGYSYETIGERLGISRSYAHVLWSNNVREIRLDGAAEAIAAEIAKLEASNERLDEAEDQARSTLARRHYVVTQKGTVEDEDGNLIEDDEHILKYVDRILKLEEQRGRNHDRMVKLRGLAQPVVAAVDQTVTYKIIGLSDEEDAQ